MVELHAVVGMECARAPICTGGWAEFNPLALRENALHRGLERDVPHVGADSEGSTQAEAGNQHAILARLAEVAEVEAMHRRLGVVECFVDRDLFLATVRFGEFGLPGEDRLARGIQQLEGASLCVQLPWFPSLSTPIQNET